MLYLYFLHLWGALDDKTKVTLKDEAYGALGMLLKDGCGYQCAAHYHSFWNFWNQ